MMEKAIPTLQTEKRNYTHFLLKNILKVSFAFPSEGASLLKSSFAASGYTQHSIAARADHHGLRVAKYRSAARHPE